MNQEVTDYINNLNNKPKQEWQADVASRLRQVVYEAIPDADERLQYGKPHYRKNGKYAAVISTAKGYVTFMIFNGDKLDIPDGLFEPGKSSIKITEGQVVDYDLLAKLLKQASSAL
jgi:hypothetical protein